MASNKTKREMPGESKAIEVNEKLKRDKIYDKNEKFLTIIKSQVKKIPLEKFTKSKMHIPLRHYGQN